MLNRSRVSLWDATAAEPEPVSGPVGDNRVALAIVGGGFTGLSTALHAAERGIDCHVLEARHIGHGGSGRNAGLVNAGMWLPPQQARQRLGEQKGSALIRTLGEAPGYVMSLVEKHQIRCELTRNGTIHAAHGPAGYRDLEQRAEEWHRLGAPVDLLSRDQAAKKIGSTAFHGGLLDRRAGTINPMGYSRGLARAAVAAGARISVGAQVQSLQRHGNDWILDTGQGRIVAHNVVLATNAYTDGLWPGLRKTFTIIRYFQLATAPLGQRAAGILPEGQGLWDTGRIMFSLRKDQHDRLIVGSMGRVIGGTTGLSRRWATRTLRRLFPDLGPVAFESAWHGDIAMTPDHLPRIHRLAENLYTPIGYNGRGITTGTIFGKAMAELVAGGSEADLPLPVTEPRPAAMASTLSRLGDFAFTANQFLRSL